MLCSVVVRGCLGWLVWLLGRCCCCLLLVYDGLLFVGIFCFCVWCRVGFCWCVFRGS